MFPGFCQQHEAVFKRFEARAALEDETDIVLQIYRTACREVARLEAYEGSLERLIIRYKETRDAVLLRNLLTQLGPELARRLNLELEPGGLAFDRDPWLAKAASNLEDTSMVLGVTRRLLANLERAALGFDADTTASYAFCIDAFFPVALSGLGSFYVREGDVNRRVLALLGVFPDMGRRSTMLSIHGHPADASAIAMYLSSFESALGVLNMVEQWMIRGTDHWFLCPTVWTKKSLAAQRVVLDEIMDGSQGIDSWLKFSILDQARGELLARVDGRRFPEIVEREAAKLALFF